MIIERVFPSGAWCVSGLVSGHLVTKVYYGYSRKESLAKFKREELECQKKD